MQIDCPCRTRDDRVPEVVVFPFVETPSFLARVAVRLFSSFSFDPESGRLMGVARFGACFGFPRDLACFRSFRGRTNSI